MDASRFFVHPSEGHVQHPGWSGALDVGIDGLPCLGDNRRLLVLRNGTLIDGSGAVAVVGDLLVADGRIAALGRFDAPSGVPTIDCSGQIVAPGFIDIHSHSDLQVLQNDRAKADQGVTTEVVGNCGFSAFPYTDCRESLHQFANGILYGHDKDWGWRNAREYLQSVEQAAKVADVYSLVGHGSLRTAYMGQRQGVPEPKELESMEGALAESLEGGAAGFSTGLMYAPGSSAPWEELLRLCQVVARHGKVYATHMRSYGQRLLDSLQEQIDLARESGVRLQISHLQAVGRGNWEKQVLALELIERARDSGIDIEFDSYPYLAGSTVMTQLLPQRAMDGGMEALMGRLRNSQECERLAAETTRGMAQEWSDIFIASVGSKGNQHLVGKSVAEIAAEREVSGIDAAIDLLLEENGSVNILSFNQSEENLRHLLTHPLCTVISDGFYVKGRPHPRLYGTFPCLLGEMVRRRQWLTLPEAIHKITGKPAQRFGMLDRGILKPGYRADITVFDPALIEGRATYEVPEAAPEGIKLVLRGGLQITPPCESKN